jgi:hypothetical protein
MLKLKQLARSFTGDSFQNSTAGVIRYTDLPDDTEITPIQLIAEDGVMSRGMLYKRRGVKTNVAIHMMHPRSDSANYNILPMVSAGYAILVRASRWPNNDVTTVHELLLLDFAAGVKYLREAGYEKIIHLGNSGGSSLGAFYQAQATAPKGTRLTHTPGGDPCDLNTYDLPPLDGVAFLAGHPGQGVVLGKQLDPAVVDEDDPLLSDPELDLYDPRNGFVTPPASSSYSEDFLTRYRAAQIARVRRIDAKALAILDRQREAKAVVEKLGSAASLTQIRAAKLERHMIIYRGTADPAWVDLGIEPDDRNVFSYRTPRPDMENFGDNAFARVITPRAWLSTWSALASNANTIENVAKFSQPFIIVHYTGDAGTRMSEVQQIYDRSPSPDKQLHLIRGHDHYGYEIKADGTKGLRTWEGSLKIVEWIQERFGD